MPTMRKMTAAEGAQSAQTVKPTSRRAAAEDGYRGQKKSNPTAGRVVELEDGLVRFSILMDCGGGHIEELWGRTVNRSNTSACEIAAEDGFCFAYHAGYNVKYEGAYLFHIKERPVTTNQNLKTL